jgi:hypothetical protein
MSHYSIGKLIAIFMLGLLAVGAILLIKKPANNLGEERISNIDPELLKSLPPDPGEAGKATLEGIDSDDDGVRDDVQRYIVLTYPDSEKTRAGLTQYAQAAQQTLLDADNEARSIANANERVRAIDCLRYILGSVDSASLIRDELKAKFLNTTVRIKLWIRADGQLGGQVFRGTPIAERKDQCSFDPDEMKN